MYIYIHNTFFTIFYNTLLPIGNAIYQITLFVEQISERYFKENFTMKNTYHFIQKFASPNKIYLTDKYQ